MSLVVFEKSIENNINVDEIIKKLNSNQSLGCITKRILGEKYKILKKIGTPSINGQVSEACNIGGCNVKFVIKKVPFDIDILENYKSIQDLPASVIFKSKSDFLIEIFFLAFCKMMIKKNKFPHLPFSYTWLLCDDPKKCKFNKNVTENQNKINGCGFLLVEKAKGDLKNFLKNEKYSYLDLMVIFYHIFSGLYILGIHFKNFSHNDLHWGNILYEKVDKTQGYIKYKINNKTHKIPNIGFRFFIWDFGYSRLNYDTDNSKISQDYYRIVHNLPSSKGTVSESSYFEQKSAKIDLLYILSNSNTPFEVLDNLNIFIEKVVHLKNKNMKILNSFNIK